MGHLTVSELKSYPLPIKNEQWDKITDPQIQVVIDYASQHVDDYLDRPVSSAYYTERIPGSGMEYLILEHRPITLLLSVASYDYAENPTTYLNSQFFLDSSAGMLYWVDRARNAFYRAYNYVVQYRAGYTEVPGPIKHATALQTLAMLQPLFRGGTQFVEIELIGGINEQVVDMLEHYKRSRIW